MQYETFLLHGLMMQNAKKILLASSPIMFNEATTHKKEWLESSDGICDLS